MVKKEDVAALALVGLGVLLSLRKEGGGGGGSGGGGLSPFLPALGGVADPPLGDGGGFIDKIKAPVTQFQTLAPGGRAGLQASIDRIRFSLSGGPVQTLAPAGFLEANRPVQTLAPTGFLRTAGFPHKGRESSIGKNIGLLRKRPSTGGSATSRRVSVPTNTGRFTFQSGAFGERGSGGSFA